MSENKTNTPQSVSKAAKKSSFKSWWIIGLTAFLVITVAGSVFYTMNQKTSKSQASPMSNYSKSKILPRAVKPCLKGDMQVPCPVSNRKPNVKKENPYEENK